VECMHYEHGFFVPHQLLNKVKLFTNKDVFIL